MQIDSIDVAYHYYHKSPKTGSNNETHIKALPYLSVVQSKIGSYGISLDGGAETLTGEGNFFIAPSICTQKIRHIPNCENIFCARFIFLDVVINKKYRFDDIFELPLTTSGEVSSLLSEDFDKYESADCICDRMSCIYGIIKHLIGISREKKIYRTDKVYPLIEYIRANYSENITVAQMAEILNVSQSHLFGIFEKATGTSPVRYLNDYRLSIASDLLRRTNKSIKEISERVGIGDQFYFSKLFKAKYDLSPQKYRNEEKL